MSVGDMTDQRLARSFRGIGEDYDRYRPGFPDAAIAAILPDPVGTVLDLGAGTGKLTASLTGRAERVIAVEPADPMRAVLERALPGVDARDGAAEAIPCGDATVDVVTVAQAFHWFERERACAEIRRVLVPQGVLGLVWNHSAPSCAWDRACTRVAHPGLGQGLTAAEGSTQNLPGFDAPRFLQIPWSESISRDDYIARWLTVSSFLAADPPERTRMVLEVERILDKDPATSGRDVFALPQITDVYVYRAL